MNTFHAIEVDYLRPSRTIETILLENDKDRKILYVYNYEGWHFRVFNTVLDVVNFFDDKFEPEIQFEDENELDDYFRKYDFKKTS